MNPFAYTAQLFREFTRRWGSYLTLVAAVTVATDLVVLPVIRWAAAECLRLGGVPYLSYDNAGAVLLGHPWVMLGLACLLLVLLVMVYLQFAWLLGGVDNIRRRRGDSLRQVFVEGLRDLGHLRVESFLFFAFYLLLIVPFGGTVVGSSFLAKIRIPTFIEEWLTAKPLLALLVAVFYVVMGYLAIRWLRVLPNTILADLPLPDAARRSWQETRGRFWHYLWRGLVIVSAVALLNAGWSALLVALQTWADGQPFAFIAAVITTSSLLAGRMWLWGLGTVCYLLFLAAPDNVLAQQPQNAPKPKHHWLHRLALIAFAAVALLAIAGFGGGYMYGMMDDRPLTISHRGVDAGNGVQNTLPALRKTAAEHPDYVEIDLHETKDGQFVLMHDENLKALTGVDARPRQLTLAELTSLTARENGHRAKLVSFDDYLAEAESLHQKLLVELKPTAQDSKDAVVHFANRYGARLHRDGSAVHSLSYTELTRLHRLQPKLKLSFVMPYSLITPQTAMDAYTVEESTLDDTFIDAAHHRKQKVLAWTVNTQADMNRMLFLGVDGIITDNLHELQTTIRENTERPAYAQRLEVFAHILDDYDNGTVDN